MIDPTEMPHHRNNAEPALYPCCSGRHVWFHRDDARLCCAGWRRVRFDEARTSRTRVASVQGFDPSANTPGVGAYGFVWERES